MQKTSQNADDVGSFTKRIEQLTVMLQKLCDGANASLSKGVRDRIERLSQCVLLLRSRVYIADLFDDKDLDGVGRVSGTHRVPKLYETSRDPRYRCSGDRWPNCHD